MTELDPSLVDFRKSVVAAVLSKKGLPFRHHYKPVNLCGGVFTRQECMEVGMDGRGFDCSGLVIASVCTAAHVDVREWDDEYRHVPQLMGLSVDTEPEAGDALIMRRVTGPRPPRNHMGILIKTGTIAHASGKTQKVEIEDLETVVEPGSILRVVPLSVLIKLAQN